jgi:uncharacterized protein (DUF924 family)
MIDADWANDVLAFWFEELRPQDWFERSDLIDDTIRARFGQLHSALAEAAPSMTFDDPQTALAAIIVFDQFSRNMFRGEPRAFATDSLALFIARHAIEQGYDATVPEQWRHFFYMPLMHSETAADQEHCVALFAALPGDSVKYAIEHRDIIARFGRFPHRNQILGRKTTNTEQAFLAEHKGFGQ